MINPGAVILKTAVDRTLAQFVFNNPSDIKAKKNKMNHL